MVLSYNPGGLQVIIYSEHCFPQSKINNDCVIKFLFYYPSEENRHMGHGAHGNEEEEDVTEGNREGVVAEATWEILAR